MVVDYGEVQTAVVLQGGGALGAYEFGVLKALYEQRPGFKPVAVAGVSIGAITAAVLGGAKGDPISALERLWRDKLTVSPPLPIGWLPRQIDQSLSMLGNPGMYRLHAGLFTAPWTCTSLYDTAPLRQTLDELVDPATLNDEETRVFVGAINVGTGEMAFFHSPELTFEHVAASGSLPPGFPMTRIEGEWYWDGGLFSNTPLSPAINALEEAAGGDPSAIRELIVVELFPMDAPVPRTLSDVVQRMVQLQYTSRLKLDKRFFDKIDRFVDLMARIDEELPDGSAIRSDQTYKDLRSYRKINHFNVVTSTLPEELSNASDFSRSTIGARIQAGYDDAITQGIGRCDAPGLRFGITEAGLESATSRS
ncbi:MAG: patatin-like phospholipase family protein [Actinomycetota bacterium]|nr:patatin-like phospholipase family protein [Actinomycetota bacterium]